LVKKKARNYRLKIKEAGLIGIPNQSVLADNAIF
jgi:hypothetical protein